MVNTNQFKNGNHIDVDGTVFKILDFQHVKPGKGGAFVRTKLRRASDGNVIDRTFRAGEKFRSVRTDSWRGANGLAWTRDRANTSRGRKGPTMRRSDQRRAAVVALYQHDLTGRPLVETLGPNASLFARALP